MTIGLPVPDTSWSDITNFSDMKYVLENLRDCTLLVALATSDGDLFDDERILKESRYLYYELNRSGWDVEKARRMAERVPDDLEESKESVPALLYDLFYWLNTGYVRGRVHAKSYRPMRFDLEMAARAAMALIEKPIDDEKKAYRAMQDFLWCTDALEDDLRDMRQGRAWMPELTLEQAMLDQALQAVAWLEVQDLTDLERGWLQKRLDCIEACGFLIEQRDADGEPDRMMAKVPMRKIAAVSVGKQAVRENCREVPGTDALCFWNGRKRGQGGVGSVIVSPEGEKLEAAPGVPFETLVERWESGGRTC